MVKYYRTDDKKIYEFSELTQGIWIDMVNPTVSEGEEVAEKLNIDIQDLLAALDEEDSQRKQTNSYTILMHLFHLTKSSMKKILKEVSLMLQCLLNSRLSLPMIRTR